METYYFVIHTEFEACRHVGAESGRSQRATDILADRGVVGFTGFDVVKQYFDFANLKPCLSKKTALVNFTGRKSGKWMCFSMPSSTFLLTSTKRYFINLQNHFHPPLTSYEELIA